MQRHARTCAIALAATTLGLASSSRADAPATAPASAPTCAAPLAGDSPATLAKVPFAAIARAAVPGFDPGTGKAPVVDGLIANCRGHRSPVSWEDDGNGAPTPGTVKEGGRNSLPDGRQLVCLETGSRADNDVGGARPMGFVALARLVREPRATVVIDAVGAWSRGECRFVPRTLAGRPVFEDQLQLSGTGGGVGSSGTRIWAARGGELVVLASLVTSGSDTTDQMGPAPCGWGGDFDTKLDYGAVLKATVTVTWARQQPKKCKQKPKGPIVRVYERVLEFKSDALVEAKKPQRENPLDAGPPTK